MTSLLTVKLRRDLQAAWSRIVLMVIAIAVSLTVFSGVLYAWSAINRETEQAYLRTEPASATIRFGPPIDAEEMAAIAAAARRRPGVIEAAGRAQFTSEIEVNSRARDIPLQVFVAAPDDPMRMAKFWVRQGHWPPAPGKIFIRRDSLALLDVAVGDTVTVETPDGESARLRVAGTVYDPSLAPAPQQQTGQGYLSTASLARLGEPEVLDQLKLQVAEPGQAAPSRDREAIAAVASRAGEWLQQEHGLAIREIQVPKPYAHPHQGQAKALLSALLTGAGAALLLSTILVANMLNGLFVQQIPQIGIMKAIGAPSGRIGLLYLAMTLTVAGAATLLALAPGLLIGRAFAPRVFRFLGIEADSVAAAWWTYLGVIAAGLVLPVLMALGPLVKASRTTVRAAIDYRGLGSSPRVATGFLARLGRIPRFDRSLLMALRNTSRRPARFLLSAGLLASAGMMFVAGMSAREGTKAVAEEAQDKLRWDVVVKLANPTSVEALAPVVERVPGVGRIEGWTIASAGVSGPGKIPITRTYPDQGHGSVFVTAIPAGTTMLKRPELQEGRWLRPGETGAIVLSQVTLANTGFDVHAGGTVELSVDGESTDWRVAGIVEERGDAGGAYVTAEGLAKALGQPRWSNTLRIATGNHDERSREAVANAVDGLLTGAGIEVQSAVSVGQQEAATGGHLEPILVILLATALPMGVIGCIGLASAMGANVLERTRELGVMHAIGASPKDVRRIVVAEGVFTALASCLLAVIPALGLTAAMGAMLGNLFFYAPLPFRISFLAAAIWTVLVILGAILATQAAAIRASRLTVREALAYL
ncbi:MAG TPA: FtsX-like permease family protein [Thermoanaerobaculia bacterium]|jgi:putative ABC transport system permease protein|nr:FtsX-like permease family protein [Thermoanaerobaculia bacterium]